MASEKAREAVKKFIRVAFDPEYAGMADTYAEVMIAAIVEAEREAATKQEQIIEIDENGDVHGPKDLIEELNSTRRGERGPVQHLGYISGAVDDFAAGRISASKFAELLGARDPQAFKQRCMTYGDEERGEPVEGSERPRKMLFRCRGCDNSEWVEQPTGTEAPPGWVHRGDGPDVCPTCAEASTPAPDKTEV